METLATQAKIKNGIGLDWQNNNHAFLLYDYDVQVPNFTFCRGLEHMTTFFILFLNFDTVL